MVDVIKGTPSWQELHNAIFDIMVEHGPDGHVDGIDQLTDFMHAQLTAFMHARITELETKLAIARDDFEWIVLRTMIPYVDLELIVGSIRKRAHEAISSIELPREGNNG